jgi:hypothetical protein
MFKKLRFQMIDNTAADYSDQAHHFQMPFFVQGAGF